MRIKNAMKYYYNLNVLSVKKINNNYIFNVEYSTYMLEEVFDLHEIDEIYKVCLDLTRYIKISKIVANRNNEPYTLINNKYYVLMKIYCNNREIDISYLLNPLAVRATNSSLIRASWATMWSEKVDYIEGQLKGGTKKNAILLDSVNYYIGLTENAIQLVKNVNAGLYVSHKRMRFDYREVDFYNALNLIFDTRVRDVAEYIKDAFFNGVDVSNIASEYIINSNMNMNERKLFFGRLLYPSYYFDEYEKLTSSMDSKISTIIERADNYEKFLRTVYADLKLDVEIDWLLGR